MHLVASRLYVTWLTRAVRRKHSLLTCKLVLHSPGADTTQPPCRHSSRLLCSLTMSKENHAVRVACLEDGRPALHRDLEVHHLSARPAYTATFLDLPTTKWLASAETEGDRCHDWTLKKSSIRQPRHWRYGLKNSWKGELFWKSRAHQLLTWSASLSRLYCQMCLQEVRRLQTSTMSSKSKAWQDTVSRHST